MLDGSATASATASDGLSGVASESCDPNSSTSAIGEFMVSGQATDNAGNSRTSTAGYKVAEFLGSWSSPQPKSTLVKSAASLPVKFTLPDVDGVMSGSQAQQLMANNQLRAVLSGPGTDTTIRPQSGNCTFSSTSRLFQCSIETPKGLMTGRANQYVLTVK